MLNIEDGDTCWTYRKDMPCKQNECYDIKFNQCYPINPSI